MNPYRTAKPRHSRQVALPSRKVNKFEAFYKNSNKYVKLGVLAIALLIAVTLVTLSYYSQFDNGNSGHRPNSSVDTSGNTQADKPAAAVNNSGMQSPPSQPSKNPVNTPSVSSIVNTNSSSVYPSSILDLSNWKLTLPIPDQSSGQPMQIEQPQLNSYLNSPYFQLDSQKNGVQFEAPVGGVTTSGSNFPRSELREMSNNGTQDASWSTTSGTSVMSINEAITHLPSVRPELVAGQVHGASAYVILIRLDGNHLFVEGPDGSDLGDLNNNYDLGTEFNVQIVASNGYINVYYNGQQKADYANDSSGDYFKAGCYTQSNPSYGDSPSAYGQVIIYGLNVSHSS